MRHGQRVTDDVRSHWRPRRSRSSARRWRTRQPPSSSSRARPSRSRSATRPAAATTSTAGWLRAISASTFPASPPSWRRTCRAPAASRPRTTSTRSRRKDGTALGVVVESAALEQALSNPAAQYDAAKFTYVGRVATWNNIFMQWHTSKVQSIEDSQSAWNPRSPAPARVDRRDRAAAAQRARRHEIQAGQRLSRPRTRRCSPWSAARSKARLRHGRP